jgi:hypothetical protein
MSVYNPPYIPPVGGQNWPGGTPPINPTPIPLPPWIRPQITPMDLPPTDAQVAAVNAAQDMTQYPQGPFCFGLDAAICGNLPRKIHVGPTSGVMSSVGFDIPVWGFCGALLNTLCGVMVAIILLALLGIAFSGLIQP